MGQITDYSSLKAEIRNYLKRGTDLADDTINGWIQLANVRINRDVLARKTEVEALIDVTTGEGVLPSDFGKETSISFDVYPMPPQFEAPQAWHETSESQEPVGTPRRYTIEAGLLKVKPTPDQMANARVVYKQKMIVPSDTNPTNTILTEFPDVYLYGTLLAGMPWIGNDPRSLTWATFYQEAVDAIEDETLTERFPHGGIRMTMSIRPVRTGRARVAQSSS